MKRRLLFLALIISCISINLSGFHKAFAKEFPVGKGTMEVTLDSADGPFELRVYTYRPAAADADSRVVMVMHGASRNADDYRDVWVDAADKYNCIIVAPMFDKFRFPGSWSYNMGNLYSATGRRKSINSSAFTIVEQLFSKIRAKYQLRKDSYYLFGHSGGGQFAHRMVLFGQAQRAERVVAANSGVYTIPDKAIALPYGTQDTGFDRQHYQAVYAKDLTIMVGERDNNPYHRMLNRSDEAMAQGSNRLERGKNFFNTTRTHAEQLGVDYRWSFKIIPGVAHSPRGMSRAAAEYFFDSKP